MYSRKVSDVNEERGADNQIKMASIRDCMDDNLLHALCIMGEIEGALSLEEATTKKSKNGLTLHSPFLLAVLEQIQDRQDFCQVQIM